MNGYTVADRKQVGSFQELKDDGIDRLRRAGSIAASSRRRTTTRRARAAPDGPDGPGTHLGWGFAWPANRRNMYNRASADPDGQAVVRAQAADVVGRGAGANGSAPTSLDFEPTKPPRLPAGLGARTRKGMDALDGDCPFIMIADGKAVAVRAVRPQGRAAAGALRAGRIAGPQPAVRTAEQPGREDLGARRQPAITRSATRASRTR